MSQPACIDATEITAEGNINQMAILMNRAHLVEKLYAAMPGDPDVFILD